MNQTTSVPLRRAGIAQLAGARSATKSAGERSGLTFASLAVAAYLWVIHSHKVPLAAPALAIGLAALLIQRTPARLPAPWWWFIGFVGWTFLITPMSPHPDMALAGAWNFAKLATIFFLVANLAATRSGARAFIVAWLAIYALYPVRGTLFNLVFGYGVGGRNAWNFIFANPNDLATLTLPILAMSLAILPSAKGWIRGAALLGVAILPVLIFATQSRGGILALGILVASLGLDQWRTRGTARRRERIPLAVRRRRQMAVGVGLVLATIGVVKFAPSGVWERMRGILAVTRTADLGTVDDSGSAEQRFEIWRVSWAISTDHPLTGVGAQAYPTVHQQYALQSRFKPTAQGARDTHSLYLNTLAETGVIGLLLFLGMLVSAFRQLARLQASGGEADWMARALRAGLVAFLAASVFATMGHIPFLYLYLGLICLLSAVYAPPVQAPPRSLRAG